MRIIFLDFYGVMTGPDDWDEYESASQLYPGCGKLIRDFCLEMDAKIVITSDAVQLYGDEKIEDILESAVQKLVECGVSEDLIVGYTHQPEDSVPYWDRPNQIKSWVEEHQVKDYVIFDDLPLPFSPKDVEDFRNRIRTWNNSPEYIEKWVNRLPEPNPEAAERFIRVDPHLGTGLTAEHLVQARKILEK